MLPVLARGTQQICDEPSPMDALSLNFGIHDERGNDVPQRQFPSERLHDLAPQRASILRGIKSGAALWLRLTLNIGPRHVGCETLCAPPERSFPLCIIWNLNRRNCLPLNALHDEPKFSELFMSHLLARNVRIEADLVDQLFNSSEKRLARLLLLMANFGKEGRPEPVIAKVSQETLAEMVGTTRSRVSFFMNKFRKLGFVDYNGGGLEVHSSLLNMVLHETPGITKDSDDR